jgi:hypothetical protein
MDISLDKMNLIWEKNKFHDIVSVPNALHLDLPQRIQVQHPYLMKKLIQKVLISMSYHKLQNQLFSSKENHQRNT